MDTSSLFISSSTQQSRVGEPIVTERLVEREHWVTVPVHEVVKEIFVPVEDREQIEALRLQVQELETVLRQRDLTLSHYREQHVQMTLKMADIEKHNITLSKIVNLRAGEVNGLMNSTALMEQSKAQPIRQNILIENIITKPVIIENVVERVIDKPVLYESVVEVPVEKHVVVPIERQVDKPIMIEQLVDKPVHYEREVIVEQEVRRHYDVPRIVEQVTHREIPKSVIVEQEVRVPKDVPVLVEVTRPVDRPYIVEHTTQVLVDRPVHVEQPVVYQVDKPVDVPVMYESVVERPVPIDRPVLVESVVERVVERPVYQEVIRQRPVEVNVMYESVKPVHVDVPVMVQRDVPVPVIVQKDVLHHSIVDVPVVVQKVVEKPIFVETVVNHVAVQQTQTHFQTQSFVGAEHVNIGVGAGAPMWQNPTINVISPQAKDEINYHERAFNTISTQAEGLKQSVSETDSLRNSTHVRAPKLLKKSNEQKLTGMAPGREGSQFPELAPMTESYTFDEANSPFKNDRDDKNDKTDKKDKYSHPQW